MVRRRPLRRRNLRGRKRRHHVGGLARMIRVSRAAFALLLASAAPAFAQAPVPSPSAFPSPAPDGRPAIELSLDETVRRTLENNADIAVERFSPESSDYTVRVLQGSYEPYLASTAGKRPNTSPATNAFTGAAALETTNWTYNVGAFQSLPTGGAF